MFCVVIWYDRNSDLFQFDKLLLAKLSACVPPRNDYKQDNVSKYLINL